MKIKIFILSILLSTILYCDSIKAAGSTFAAPMFYSLAYHYYQEKGIDLNYQSIGSFSGINILKLGSIDFASSEKSLKEDELKKFNLVQFPLFTSSIDIVCNIKGIQDGKLKITNNILAQIFLGKITYWDDPKILHLNKTLQLPHEKIVVVSREGESGTTYSFTQFLNNSSILWAKEIGVVKALQLEDGKMAKGNEGVSNKILTTPFSIGYLPSPYRKVNKLSRISIEDKNGKWTYSNDENYPIEIVNYLLVLKQKYQSGKKLSEFFSWVANKGPVIAKELGYKISLKNNF